MSGYYKSFTNQKCEYFPCHKGIDENVFNCLFCYCPLYLLGDRCGGNFSYLDSGIKNCSECKIPHSANGYDYIMSKMDQLMKIASE